MSNVNGNPVEVTIIDLLQKEGNDSMRKLCGALCPKLMSGEVRVKV
ncbi:hypothetical protein [Leptonema illini]|uniref:Uncharacterized protein n=1 Tax=Leptonema illini DSM 21528 TaxID=929563 RepID=H2CGZ5_9LEPT|nr:hypothetical protein [Leptonema illini]EHQ05837.1 hypothetical protein Lepil_1142 [Leptonema illini DSM 21528]